LNNKSYVIRNVIVNKIVNAALRCHNFSYGFLESDLHGTIRIVWAIATALDLFGDDAPSGAEKWKYHKA